MPNKTIIILAKTPELGKVKTRIAAALGDEKALAIYTKLLDFTFSLLKQLSHKKIVYYSGNGTQAYWEGLAAKEQTNGDLGNRMATAFQEVLNTEAESCIIIGTDCATLTKEIIETAFHELVTKDIVVGPASDGGYYLLGMNQLHPSLFQGIDWSTEHVFTQTLKQVESLSLQYALLPMLTDTDEVDQVPTNWY